MFADHAITMHLVFDLPEHVAGVTATLAVVDKEGNRSTLHRVALRGWRAGVARRSSRIELARAMFARRAELTGETFDLDDDTLDAVFRRFGGTVRNLHLHTYPDASMGYSHDSGSGSTSTGATVALNFE